MTEPVTIETGGPDERVELPGDLAVPDGAVGIVLFAHGSGSSRHSRRNRAVAELLQQQRVATLLFDLLTETEGLADASTAHLRFDIGLLGRRLVDAVDSTRTWPASRALPVGLFGASTGAAAALVAASERPDDVRAVVSRGGRPDLAADALSGVRTPTLLIVGERDEHVLSLNREASARLAAPHRIEIVNGASHLFEEPGALEHVAQLAAGWFRRHLAGKADQRVGAEEDPGQEQEGRPPREDRDNA